MYVCIHTYRLGDISTNLGEYLRKVVNCCKVAGHAFGCFRRIVAWLSDFVSIRQLDADFHRLRAF